MNFKPAFYSFVVCMIMLISCDTEKPSTSDKTSGIAHKVNPFIGTGGHGHTYPGAVLPFGMVQLSPDNGTEGWDWCSGYHYSDSMIAGFSHLHLSGTGIGDLADISFMPYYSQDLSSQQPQSFQHKNEQAVPGTYSVQFDNGIVAELTATERVGYHRYLFPDDSIQNIVLDLGFAINWDEPVATKIEVVNDTLITGYRKSTGWAKDQHVFFAAVFSKSIQNKILSDSTHVVSENAIAGKAVKGVFSFEASKTPLMMKVSISSANVEGAVANIRAETSGWNFNQVKADAFAKWENQLGRIDAEMIAPAMDTIFYSALYHTALAPALYADVNGAFKAVDGTVKSSQEFNRHTVFSLWDTFRATHPLFTITQPDRLNDMLQSILSFYDEHGLLPVWALEGNETNTMTGYHAVPVLADAILKGHLKGDETRAYNAMLKSAAQDIRGSNYYREYGYIPADKDGWSVTKTLEYAYDDWCIAQVAKKLEKEDDYQRFMERAGYYKSLFDKQTGFMRGKNSDGSWIEPFDPFYSEHGFDGIYIEGTAWQHTWFVPHDVKGMINLYGSEEAFLQFLDSTFHVTSEMTGENVSMDISGLIGQYAHGNEPSHHIAYLYNYAGKPWKTQERVREILLKMYANDVDGLPGNEDCGQMSAWYVFSALGFYPVNPAEGIYVLGSPLVNKATINVGQNKSFRIIAENNSLENKYIQQVFLNEQPLLKSYFHHKDIMNGGTLRFVMGSEPNTAWATDASVRPPSMSK